MAEDLCAPLDGNVSSAFCSSFGGVTPLEVEYTVPLRNGTNVSVWIPTSLQSSAAKRERRALSKCFAHSLLGLIRSWCWLCRSERDVQGEVRRLRNAEGVLHELHEDQGLELGDHSRDHAEAAGRAAGCRQQPRRVHHRRPLCAPESPLHKLDRPFRHRLIAPTVYAVCGTDAWSASPCCPGIDRDALPCPPNSCPIRGWNSTLPVSGRPTVGCREIFFLATF